MIRIVAPADSNLAAVRCSSEFFNSIGQERLSGAPFKVRNISPLGSASGIRLD
jgi:hypothetical protein